MTFPLDLYLFALLSGAAGAAGSLPIWRMICHRLEVMDYPGHRKIHTHPIPLAGGLAVLTGLIVPLVIAMSVVMTGSDFTDGPSPILTEGFGSQASRILTMLAGDGGDEILGGNERYAKQKVFEAYGAIPAAMRAGVIEPFSERLPASLRFALLSKFQSYVQQARIPLHWKW